MANEIVKWKDIFGRSKVSRIDKFCELKHKWSIETFGEGRRTRGLCEHIRRELVEIEARPDDPEEWIDVILLAMDGYARLGQRTLLDDLLLKHKKNTARKWPKNVYQDKPTEHLK